MYSDSLNPFGLLDGQLVTINDVSSGLACGCLCPACKQPLVARKGSQKVHHFAHAIKTDCKGALETALHIKAKQVFDRNSFIVIPGHYYDWFKPSFGPAYYKEVEGKKFWYSSATIEAKIGNLRPDVVLSGFEGPPFLVEIYVSHKVNSDKAEAIKSLELPCIEIDLRYLKRLDLLDDKLIENAVIRCTHTKRWINYPFVSLNQDLAKNPPLHLEPYFAGFSRRATQKYGS